MKKLVSVLLTLCLLMSLVAVAAAEAPAGIEGWEGGGSPRRHRRLGTLRGAREDHRARV